MNRKPPVGLLDSSIYYLEDSAKKRKKKQPLKYFQDQKRGERSVEPNCVYGKEKSQFD